MYICKGEDMIKHQLFEEKYKIITSLGKGGMSTVYLAQHMKLGTLWAIKQISKKVNFKIDLLAEPNILKKLSHPALPRVFDIVEDDEYLYIIADFVEGESLAKEIELYRKILESKVIDWAKQLCDVLHYLHTLVPNPIIFRDLKPANIILTYEGKIKLIDFGIAREYKKESVSDTTYMGTRGYAAPEQYGTAQTDVRTDIYSLGVTLYHLLTGKGPNEPPYDLRPVREIDQTLSQEIEYIICKCTAKDPDKRFQSIQEVRRCLQNMHLNGLEAANHSVSEKGSPAVEEAADTELLETPVESVDVKHSPRKRTGPVIFKKIVLTVWGNAEFASELAYMAAKLTDFEILLVNLDFTAPKMDYYLNLENIRCNHFGNILNGVQARRLSPERFKEGCVRKEEWGRLHVLMDRYDMDSYEQYRDKDIGGFIEYAYQNFDITLLAVNQSVLDLYTVTALLKSDYNIIPITANIDVIREFRYYTAHLHKKHTIPIQKMRYIAYEYKRGIHPSESDLKREIGSEYYMGHISYQSQRETYRNYNAMFAQHMQKRYMNEYIDILGHFNIVPKRAWGRKIRDWLERQWTGDS